MYYKKDIQRFTISTCIGDVTLIPTSKSIRVLTQRDSPAIVNKVQYSIDMSFQRDGDFWKEYRLHNGNRKSNSDNWDGSPTVSAARKIESEMEIVVNRWVKRHPLAMRTAVLIDSNNALFTLQESIQEQKEKLDALQEDFRTKQREHGVLADEDIALLIKQSG